MTKKKTPDGAKMRIRHPISGKRITIRGATEDDVRGMRATVRQQATLAKLGQVDDRTLRARLDVLTAGPLRVEPCWHSYVATLNERWSAHTGALYYRLHVGPELGALAVVELEDARLVAWERGRLAAGLSPGTVRNIGSVLRSAIRRAHRQQLIGRLPWDSWRPMRATYRERETFRHPDELRAFVRALAEEDERADPRVGYRDLGARCTVMALSFLRNAEGAALGWDQVQNLWGQEPSMGGAVTLDVCYQAPAGWARDAEPGERPRVPPKAREEGDRDPPHVVHPSVAAALRYQAENLRRRGLYREDGPIFPSPKLTKCACGHSRGVHAGGTHRGYCHCGCKGYRPVAQWRTSGRLVAPAELRRVVERAGLPHPERWTVHSLRHTAFLEYMASGGDLKGTMLRTRHRNPVVFLGYIHAMQRHLTPSAIPELGAPAPPALPERAGGEIAPAEVPPPPEPEPDTRGTFEKAYAAWRGGARPREVTRVADRAYDRAYHARRREIEQEGTQITNVELHECARAGRAARAGVLGAWKAYVTRRRKAAEKEAAE